MPIRNILVAFLIFAWILLRPGGIVNRFLHLPCEFCEIWQDTRIAQSKNSASCMVQKIHPKGCFGWISGVGRIISWSARRFPSPR